MKTVKQLINAAQKLLDGHRYEAGRAYPSQMVSGATALKDFQGLDEALADTKRELKGTTEKSLQAFQPEWGYEPYEHIFEHMQENKLTVARFAELAQTSEREIHLLMMGTTRIGATEALMLSKVFKASAQFWLNLEHNFQSSRVRKFLKPKKKGKR